ATCDGALMRSAHQSVPEKCPLDIFPCCLTPKVKWLFEQVQTPFGLLAFVSYYSEIVNKEERYGFII
ncbi:MAG: hypothetical protein K6A90_15285, partial [Lachnospiraceae bacterium]|nr:hypothetical protein [Lachnospiraceae bacterium]